MNQPLEVVFCGNTLFLAGIAAGFQAESRTRAKFRATRLEGTLNTATLELKMLSPDAVVFEISRAEPSVITGLLREYPGIILIGLEPECGLITVFSNSKQAVSSAVKLHKRGGAFETVLVTDRFSRGHADLVGMREQRVRRKRDREVRVER